MTKPARTTLLALIEAGQNAQRVLIRPLIERGLEPGDDAVLMLIGTKGATEAELEDGTGEPLDDLRPRVERLVTRELIVRTAAGLALTERGARLRDRLEEIWAETEFALTGKLKKKRRKELAKLLIGFADFLRRRGGRG
jgi:hypothetical protein